MDRPRSSARFVWAVLATLGLMALSGLMILLMQVKPGFLSMAHFREPHHRIHDLTFGFLFVPAVVGMLAQLRAPSWNIAGQLAALIPWIALVLSLVSTLVLTRSAKAGAVLNAAWVAPAAATLISAFLHPARRRLLRWFDVSRVSGAMLALVMVAAVPLFAFAFSNIRAQGTVADDHARMGHFGFMAAFALVVIGVSLLASFRPDGWRPAAWVAGLLPTLLGLASVLYPNVSSSLSLTWALAAIGWGVAFVTVAELTRAAE